MQRCWPNLGEQHCDTVPTCDLGSMRIWILQKKKVVSFTSIMDLLGYLCSRGVWTRSLGLSLVVVMMWCPGIRSQDENCPKECICQGATVDCSFRGLTMIPNGIALTTERLWVYLLIDPPRFIQYPQLIVGGACNIFSLSKKKIRLQSKYAWSTEANSV